MKKILHIYTTDIKRIVTNRSALIIIIGLIILPSLYAWFNIKASWNPYGHTQSLLVAVVNNDKGATLNGKTIHAGRDIVQSLKKNKQLGWTFTSEREAIRGVKHGTYYASIMIPGNFSKKLATILSSHPEKPVIRYDVNEKINAVAPKITDKGATAVAQKISSSFVKAVNGAIFQMFNKLGIELRKEQPTIKNFEAILFRLEAAIPDINHGVNVATSDADKAQTLISRAKTDLQLATQVTNAGLALANDLDPFLTKSKQVMDAITPNIKQDLNDLSQIALSVQQVTALLQNPNTDIESLRNPLSRIRSQIETAVSVLDGEADIFNRLNDMAGNGAFDRVIGQLEQGKSHFEAQRKIIDQMLSAIHQGRRPTSDLIGQLNAQARQTHDFLDSLTRGFDSNIAPKIGQALDKAKTSVGSAKTLLTDIQDSIPDIKKILNDATQGVATGKQQLRTIRQNLPAAEQKIRSIADKIRALEAKVNLNEVINLLTHNYRTEAAFMAEPVRLKEIKWFPIPNYGSAMSPFYTTLSFWVGALLLASLLSVEVAGAPKVLKDYHIYFGRYFTFWTIALLQSLIVTLGDLFILKTYVIAPAWFVLFGCLLSSVFMLIVYTLVSIFGNIGKALAIILLVLQIAGSGGTYPIQTTPPFFQAISPFLPFTYAISLLRETVGGMLWDIVRNDIFMLGIFALVALLLGLFLKGPINRYTMKMVKKARETELIH